MERHPKFMDQQNKCCENDYITDRDLQIQCKPIKIPTASSQKWKKNRKFYM
jgi:hypothetical protein